MAENATPSMCSQDDLSGIVEPGRGLGAGLMADEAVMERLVELAGFRVVPGTLNVRLPQPLERGSRWRYVAAAEITPDWEARTGQAGFSWCPSWSPGATAGSPFKPSSTESQGIRPTRSSCSARRTCAGSSASATATGSRFA